MRKTDHQSHGEFWMTFVGTWLLGVIAGGMLADGITWAWRGTRSDGGMYLICAFAIVLEIPLLLILRSVLGPSKTGTGFAAVFGVLSGPLVTLVCFGLTALGVW